MLVEAVLQSHQNDLEIRSRIEATLGKKSDEYKVPRPEVMVFAGRVSEARERLRFI